MKTSTKRTQADILKTFFKRNPVFTFRELGIFLAAHPGKKVGSRKSLLAYYQGKGQIIQIFRSLFGTIPRGYDSGSYQIDPYLLASKLSPCSILSYHTALELHGRAHARLNRLTYTSFVKGASFTFQGHVYHRVKPPPRLITNNAESFGIETLIRQGVEIKLTGLERTLVDILTRPNLADGWQEIWRSLELFESLNLNRLYKYLMLLDNSTTVAKVGFFLEQRAEALKIENSFLRKLEKHIPKGLHYAERLNRRNCKLFRRWNLLVSKDMLRRS